MRKIFRTMAVAPTPLMILMSVALLFMACSDKHQEETKGKKLDIAIDDSLRSRLATFAQGPRVQGKFAFHVYDLTADKPVYGYQETLSQPSASCLKLLCGVAGLHLLGSDYLYITGLYQRGKVSDGALQGDLTFKGSLDPQLNEQELVRFGQAAKKRGINRVNGKIYVDLVIQEPVKSEEHWYPWDLSFSRYGLFYKGAPRVMRSLKSVMRTQGIAFADSQVVLGTMPAGSKAIYRYGTPIHRIVKRMWKNSSNTQSTALLYTIGHHINTQADPTATGVEYLRKFLREDLGMTDTSLVVHDGCGLCTYNHLSPQALTAILVYGYKDKSIHTMLMQNLAIAGVDGSLAHEMTGPKTRGKIHAKTGTLSHPYGISSLAGYCRGSNGHDLAFAVMSSEMSVLDARVLQHRLCEKLLD